MADLLNQGQGFDPAGTTVRALQLMQMARDLRMQPDEELLSLQRLLPTLDKMDPEEAKRIFENVVSTSSFGKERGTKALQAYRSRQASDAQSDLLTMEQQIQHARDTGMAKIAQLEKTLGPMGFDMQGAVTQLQQDLERQRAVMMRQFQTQYRPILNQPDIAQGLGRFESLYGPTGQQYEFLGIPAGMQLTEPQKGEFFRGKATDPTTGADYLGMMQRRAGINPLAKALTGSSPDIQQIVQQASPNVGGPYTPQAEAQMGIVPPRASRQIQVPPPPGTSVPPKKRKRIALEEALMTPGIVSIQ